MTFTDWQRDPHTNLPVWGRQLNLLFFYFHLIARNYFNRIANYCLMPFYLVLTLSHALLIAWSCSISEWQYLSAYFSESLTLKFKICLDRMTYFCIENFPNRTTMSIQFSENTLPTFKPGVRVFNLRRTELTIRAFVFVAALVIKTLTVLCWQWHFNILASAPLLFLFPCSQLSCQGVCVFYVYWLGVWCTKKKIAWKTRQATQNEF